MGGGGHSCGHSGKEAIFIIASLIIADGFVYNIPIDKKLNFTPYFTPWELIFSMKNDKEDNISAVGAGLCYTASKHLVCKANVEYDRTSLLADSKEGYSANVSIGYEFNK